jgi:hypothetical protein
LDHNHYSLSALVVQAEISQRLPYCLHYMGRVLHFPQQWFRKPI